MILKARPIAKPKILISVWKRSLKNILNATLMKLLIMQTMILMDSARRPYPTFMPFEIMPYRIFI